MTHAGTRGPARPYRLLFELGRGGMGTVYLAVSEGPKGFSKLKVVKKLRPWLAEDPQFFEMFFDEARLSARFRHPNVVQTNEVGFDGNEYFIEMEYLEGQPYEALLRRVSKGAACPLDVHVWILTQTLAGLHYAHELKDHDGRPLNVVHRDVSPHNVFLTYDGVVKVLDFGIAKAADSSAETRTGMVKGKATYMAPEQALRQPVDRRADVFSVGVMLWQALVGKRLWGELQDVEIFQRMQQGQIPAVREACPADAPEALVAICERATAFERDARYATAAELQAALERALDESESRAGPRKLATVMSGLFAQRREAVQAEIDAQLRSAPSSSSQAEVPVLGRSEAYRATKTGETRAEGQGVRTATGGAPSDVTRTVDTTSGDAVTSQAPPRRRSSWARLGLGAAALLVVGGAVVEWRVQGRHGGEASAVSVASPCKTARDCLTKGPRLVCSESGACVAPAECVSNKECIDAHGGAPYACRKTDGRCVDLKAHGCQPLAEPGDFANDDTIWFGVLLPTTGDEAVEYGTIEVHGIDLGRQDFAKMTGGIASVADPGRTRPIALVVCDDSAETPDPAVAARYLAADLRVPGIIGFPTSKQAIDLATKELIPRDVLSVVAIGASALITSIAGPPGSPRLVWRTTETTVATAPAVAAILRDIDEPALRASGAVPPDQPIRVALLRMGTSTGLGFAAALYPILRFNGKSAVENDTDFVEIPYGDPSGAESKPDYARAIQRVVAFRPHVILALGTSELGAELLEPIERDWPATAPRPLYVSSSTLDAAMLTFLGGKAERRKRVFGVSVPSQTLPNVQLVTRYNEVFADHITTATAPSSGYDAFYLLAYAAAAARTDALTGDALAHGIELLLPPGPTIDVGPANVLEGLGRLRAGGRIDLNGSMSPLDFSTTTGETPLDLVVTCARLDEAGRVTGEMDSGFEYARATGAIRGKSRCR